VWAGVADLKGGSMTVGESERSVWVRRLFLSCFRSYLTFDLSLDRRPVVLTGPNGAGKTNLLEAISLLAPGQGLRGARLSELLHRGGPAAQASPASLKWAVSLELETPRGCRSLGTALDTAADGRERRSTKIDGEPQRGQASLGEVFRLVWLTPQMDGLLREGPADRRRFLDRLVCAYDPAHASRGHAYDYAQRQRARLFREGIEDPAWLASLEDAMARHGVAQVAARRELVTRLTRVAAGFGPFPSAQLDIECPIDSWLGEAPALAVEDRFKEALARARAADRESGATTLGPHRSDLLVTHRDKALPARLCSTGEQKAVLLSVIIAHARLLALELGAAPVLLLDEVIAHLDRDRRRALFEEILALGMQAWMTGTDEAVFAELGPSAQFLALNESRLGGQGRTGPAERRQGA